MKIIVCNPPWPGEGYGTRSNIRWPHRRGDKVLTFPIYLAYATAILKSKGFETLGIDAVDKEYGSFEFVEKAKAFCPDMIFMEVSAPSIMYDLECAAQLKEEINCIIIFCGPHMTLNHKKILKAYNFVDICIRGEFDSAMCDICIAIKNKKSLREVPGITFRHNGKVIVNSARSYNTNLDDLPFPDRNDWPIEHYQQAFFSGKKCALVISSRGCPSRCTFCIWPQTINGHTHRTRSPKNVADEMEWLKNRGVDEIYFDDDTFIVDRKRVIALCQEIINRKINLPWLCMARVNNVDEELLKIMRRAGCKTIFYGFESGSQRILNSVKKGTTLEQAIKAVKMTQQADIYASGSFIIGLPEDDEKTIQETFKFAIKLGANYVQFVLAATFPGTELYEDAKKLGLLKLNSWSDLDGTHGDVLRTKYLSSQELRGIIRKLNIKYYLTPKIILVNLRKIKSIADMRKIMRGALSVLSRVIFYKN